MKSPALAFVAAASMLSGAALADTVSLSNMTATWYDGNPAANVSYSGNGSANPKARWGRTLSSEMRLRSASSPPPDLFLRASVNSSSVGTRRGSSTRSRPRSQRRQAASQASKLLPVA